MLVTLVIRFPPLAHAAGPDCSVFMAMYMDKVLQLQGCLRYDPVGQRLV